MELPLCFESIFPWHISPTYFAESAVDDYLRCLIDRPAITMKHTIIDFNASAICDMILEAAKEPPANRTKPLLGVVRGMGSGKTRCLEEIRRELLQRPGVLPIAITFNNGKDIRNDELDWTGNCHTVFAWMVIARMASALYDKDFPYVCELITKELSRLDTSELSDVGRSLLEEFLRHVVTKARSQGREVSDVVVIVDEIFMVEEKLKEIYDNKVEACAALREAMLDIKKTPFDFNTTLCISSLKRFPLGKTCSSRPVKSVGIPYALNTILVVKDWWKCDEKDERTMLYVAACFHKLPRALEIVDEFLQRHIDRPRNQIFLKELFVSVKDRLSLRYNWAEFPNNDLIYSIIFAKQVVLDTEVQRLISWSIVFNSIETCAPNESRIIPLSSLTVLAGCTGSSKDLMEKATIGVYNDILDEIVRLAGSPSEGIIFESFVVKWLQYRWTVACYARKKISLIELLGITDAQSVMLSGLTHSLDVIATSRAPIFLNLTINSYSNHEGHLKEVGDIIVSAMSPIVVLIGADGDAFDFLIKIFQGERETPLLFYIDNKSPFPDNVESIDKYKNPDDTLPQYEKVKKMCDARHIPFIYCFWTHYPGCLEVRGEDCLILRSCESEHFFGPVWSLFIAC